MPYFALTRLDIEQTCTLRQEDSFSALVGISGSGVLEWEEGSLELKQGEQLLLPAGVASVRLTRRSQEPWQLVRCFPPKPL
ncbi:cupin domain-containing protein [Paenibacillus gyeongsangnamensis]